MKILLNCLPPTDINSPSISLSILKSFMINNGIETEVKYWNFSLSVMSEYTDTEDTEIRILPFISILNDRDNNTKGNHRILSLLQKIDPSFKADDPDYYSNFLQEKKDEVYEIIHQEIADIDFSEISLFGISAKYNQWIPGMILAEEIKKIAPEVKIIVGGFGNNEVAHEAMKLCTHFDFVTWGEGEYPLLELSKQLEKESSNFDSVPRLIYREEETLKQSASNESKYLDFENYIFPDYTDFVNKHPDIEDNDQISIPINTIRSCHWRKCKFCDFNKGYKLRVRSPECIINEIEHITSEYALTTFSFVDSDTFGNLEHFEKLLDLIIDLKYKSDEDFVFWAEIIPNIQFNAQLMEKMAIAGFKNIFIGYDALTDSLLKKMNKRNSFSDNLFFVKHSLKNGINPLVNVIKHVPEETEDDVMESLNNLHFLRFYYHNSIVPFFHTYVSLVLSSMTKYYAFMSDEERNTYNVDSLTYLMPDHFSNNENRFHLFRFENNIPSNVKEWNNLTETENYYKSNKFSYKIQENKGIYYYTEYCNETEIANITFGEPEYGFILKATQNQIRSFADLFLKMEDAFDGISEERVKEILTNLKGSYLIYFDKEFSNIVSIIDLKN
ncbi:MAG: radical SAM protein [Salinivirgaceae bacterium]|nr:radical SAM protein [Salinivirgaceae bacterium]